MKIFTQAQFVVGTVREVQVAVGWGRGGEKGRERERGRGSQQALSAEEMRGGGENQ